MAELTAFETGKIVTPSGVIRCDLTAEEMLREQNEFFVFERGFPLKNYGKSKRRPSLDDYDRKN